MSTCEWNPKHGLGASGDDDGWCENEATVSVGADGLWHLCASCAALPAFKSFRRRVSLTSKEEAK